MWWTRTSSVFRSDAARFALTYLLVFVGSVAGLGVLTYQTIKDAMETALRERVEAEVKQLVGDYEDEGLVELRHDIRERLDVSVANRLRYSVQGPEGRVIFDELLPLEERGWTHVYRKDGGSILVWSEDLQDDGYVLAVGADLGEIESLSVATQQRFGVVLGLTVLLGLLGGYLLLRRSRSRLEAFRETAEKVGGGEFKERLERDEQDADLDALASIMNQMLERIERLVENTRRVGSNLAHDLRTPLTRLRHELEELAEQDSMDRERVETAIRHLDESLAVFNAILRIAEIESGARKSSFQDFDLSAELVKLAEVYEPSFDESGFEFTWSVESSKQLRGDRTLVAQSVANLLENALRHGASPVELRLKDVGARVELSVSDRGPGIPEADRERVLEPFFRRDESRTTPGSGLGLSLVRAVAELHDAELVLQDNGPGLVVKLIWS